jgi:peptidoglycan/LPS O-acetylase OafA/YrhL
MYLFVVLVMFAIVFARTGFTLRESESAVWSAVLQWLPLGLIDTQPDLNGVTARHVLAGVTWTLWYEWAFYGSLIAWAGAARRRGHLASALAALVACLAAKHLWHIDALGFAALFAIGMVVASLRHAGHAPPFSERSWSTVAALALVGAFASPGQGYGTGTALLLGVFFHAVCSGATLFGLLGTRAAQRLGTISYSLYLMQGLVLTLVFAIGPVERFASSSPLAYGAVGLLCATALVLAAAAGYRWIERPGIALGKRVARRGWRLAPSSSTASPSKST